MGQIKYMARKKFCLTLELCEKFIVCSVPYLIKIVALEYSEE